MWSTSRLPDRLEATDYARTIDEICDSAGAALLDLTRSNPSRLFDTHRERMGRKMEEAARAAAGAGYDPEPHGLVEAREAVAAYYRERGAGLDSGRITITASTSEAYTWLAKLVADPGGELLVPTPSYPLFEHLMALEGVGAVPYRFRYDGRWHLDAGDLHRAVESCDDPRAIVCVSPNNPTGHVLSDGDFDRLCEIAASRELPLIVDEVFVDFGLDHDRPPSVPRRLEERGEEALPVCFTLSGLSKTAGLPGAKVGWIAVQGEASRVQQARRRLAFVGDTFLSTSTTSQLLAARVLPDLEAFHQTVRERTRSNLAALREAFSAADACDVYPAEAGWYGLVRVPNLIDAAELTVDLARTNRVLVQPGFLYDFEREEHLVVSLLPARPTFERGIDRLAEHVADRLSRSTEQ